MVHLDLNSKTITRFNGKIKAVSSSAESSSSQIALLIIGDLLAAAILTL